MLLAEQCEYSSLWIQITVKLHIIETLEKKTPPEALIHLFGKICVGLQKYRRVCLMSLLLFDAESSKEGGQCTHPAPARYHRKIKTTFTTKERQCSLLKILLSYKYYTFIMLYPKCI